MFLSTPPSRVATNMIIHDGNGMKSFYPRHPRGWRHSTRKGMNQALFCFYPRHPRGWRQSKSYWNSHDIAVSIHATLAGGDFIGRHITTPFSVSIHATLAGGDRALTQLQLLI